MSDLINNILKSANTENLANQGIVSQYSFRNKATSEFFEPFTQVSKEELMRILPNVLEQDILSFNPKMYGYMERLMSLNVFEKNLTTSLLGANAHEFGDSDSLPLSLQSPSYSNSRNYVNFMVNSKGLENGGSLTTRVKNNNSVSGNYINGGLYDNVTNLFPNELNKGITNQWDVSESTESILYKTKKLFNNNKINTLISRFGTNADGYGNIKYSGSEGHYNYGESRGRNLLTKDAEENGTYYSINGYNNPYCRVWTHHYQYEKINKLIRPFKSSQNNNLSKQETLSEFNKWDTFKTSDKSISAQSKGTNNNWGWKGNENDGWEHSVLDNTNGFVKITPKYLGGESKNVHTKDCMFSIENLAWRGYDPYSFEKALSWEQRGPMGGRIMWFPPYGITFNESTNVTWNTENFIGRGESVYTYSNTQRTGSLSFIMLTDHPSIIDYANWYDGQNSISNGIKDSDLLRFFSGCDEETLKSAVKPTPLTDEYIKPKIKLKNTEVNTSENTKNNEPNQDQPLELIFYAFFPNNYSGMYDAPTNPGGPVNAINYLLYGYEAWFNYNSLTEQQKKSIKDSGKENIFNTKSLLVNDQNTMNDHPGYEMTENGISANTSPYTAYAFPRCKDNWTNSNPNFTDYICDNTFWHYRIDGTFKIPSDANEAYKNTFAQKLKKIDDYKDNNSSKLNSSTNNNTLITDADKNNASKIIVSLAEFAISYKDSFQTNYDFYLNNTNVSQENINKINKIKNNEIESIEIEGYATSQGNNSSEVNKNRNEILAKGRATTIKDWLVSLQLKFNPDNITAKTTEIKSVDQNIGANDTKAKLNRSAKCTIKFKTQKVENAETSVNTENEDVSRYVGYNRTNRKTVEGWLIYEQQNSTTDNNDYSNLNTYNLSYVYPENNNNDEDLNNQTTYWVDVNNSGKFMSLDDYNNNFRQGIKRVEDNMAYNPNLAKQNLNNLRYDQEYHFFKKIEKDNPIIWDRLMDKLKYFDPVFHSMTPEGFNARLTFLNQCMRQGDTITPSDTNGKTANNLAFGRPPFCVLRLGDFYNQLIVINNMNIDYTISEGISWDLNPEGNGVQPMLCKITLSFTFIGGSDMSGPVRRLQNAMSFNYYANTSLYDNRADTPKYKGYENYKQFGALDNGGLDIDNSYAYTSKEFNDLDQIN